MILQTKVVVGGLSFGGLKIERLKELARGPSHFEIFLAWPSKVHVQCLGRQLTS